MARRLAALLLLLALGCLLGILVLLLGSGDARGPPGFKVSGAARSGGGQREVPGCRSWGSRRGHVGVRHSRCAAMLPRDRRRHQSIPSVTRGAGAEGSLICGEGRREQPPPGAQGWSCPRRRPVAWHLRCGTPRLRDPQPFILVL